MNSRPSFDSRQGASRDVRQLDFRVQNDEQQDTDERYNEYQCYSLEGQQVHAINKRETGKRYFVNLSLSSTGQHYTLMKLQIDTAATCNTISEVSLNALKPNIELQQSPYLLYPYGDARDAHFPGTTKRPGGVQHRTVV